MIDYISKEDALKNIVLLNASALMGNNKEVDEAIGGYNPSSFLAGLSYGLDHAMGMISSQLTLSETEIIRKAFERVVVRLEEKKEYYRKKWNANLEDEDCDSFFAYEKAIKIVKEECGINE